VVPNRVAVARGYLDRLGLDAILVSNINNIRYLSGFTGSDGEVVISRDGLWFLTDSRYRTQAGEQVSGFTVVEYRRKLEETATLIKDQGFGKVGFEATSLTVAQHAILAVALAPVELVSLPGEFDALRSVKDREELEALGITAHLASQAFLDLVPEIRPGETERRLALRLEWLLREAGADAASFSFIVASGPRGGLPHANPTNRAIGYGELVTFDFGGIRDGYCSDETVTVAVGSADLRQREIYQVVLEAHDRAIGRVGPGVSCRDVDAAARGYITARGFGDFFGHGTGHGVGLEVHEKPVISFQSEEILQEGMVVTIEPGIYIPGWGGVRIEDTVCVTGDGCRILTKVPKELMIL
jgi:Xaa-Pro aminopeptidase